MALVPINFDLLYEDLCNAVGCLKALFTGLSPGEIEELTDSHHQDSQGFTSLQAHLDSLDDEVWTDYCVAVKRLRHQLNDGDTDLLETGELRRNLLGMLHSNLLSLPREKPSYTPEGRELLGEMVRQPLSILQEMKEIFRPDLEEEDLEPIEGDIVGVIKTAGCRLTTNEVLTALQTARLKHGESTVKQYLASMVKRGLLTSKRGGTDKGYGIPDA